MFFSVRSVFKNVMLQQVTVELQLLHLCNYRPSRWIKSFLCTHTWLTLVNKTGDAKYGPAFCIMDQSAIWHKSVHHCHITSMHAKEENMQYSNLISLRDCAHMHTNIHSVRTHTHKYAHAQAKLPYLIWKQSCANKTAPSILKAVLGSEEARLAGLVTTVEHILHLMSDQAGRY